MIEGFMMQREYKRSNHVEALYLQRLMTTTLINIVNSFGQGGKALDELDLMSIPELDDKIREKRKQQQEQFDKRAQQVLDKYRALGKRHKNGN